MMLSHGLVMANPRSKAKLISFALLFHKCAEMQQHTGSPEIATIPIQVREIIRRHCFGRNGGWDTYFGDLCS